MIIFPDCRQAMTLKRWKIALYGGARQGWRFGLLII